MFRKFDENKPIKVILDYYSTTRKLLGESNTIEEAFKIMQDYLGKQLTIDSYYQNYYNYRGTGLLTCDYGSYDAHISFTNIELKD